jgi:hypothetical protein
VAEAARVDVIICTTETGALAQRLHNLSDRFRIIAATTNRDTFDDLTRTGQNTILLPLRAANKYSQLRHAISVALRATRVAIGDLVMCAISRDVYPEEGDLVVLTDVEPSIEHLVLSDVLRLTDGIQLPVIEAAVTVAGKVGRAARRGKRTRSAPLLLRWSSRIPTATSGSFPGARWSYKWTPRQSMVL